MAGQLPDQDVREDFHEPRWEFDCTGCSFETYGYEDIRQAALQHVRETGHTIGVSCRRWGHLRPTIGTSGSGSTDLPEGA